MVEKLDDMELNSTSKLRRTSTYKRLPSRLLMVFSIKSQKVCNDPEGETITFESVEFESEEQYREKLEMLKESFREKTQTAKQKLFLGV